MVSTYYLYIVIKILVIIARTILLRNMVGLSPSMFAKDVVLPAFKTTLIAVIPSILIVNCMPSSIGRLIISIVVALLSVFLSSFFIGMTLNERRFIVEYGRKTLSFLYK